MSTVRLSTLSTKTSAPLPYAGADASVAPDLGGLFDECKHVTIAFCGGMAILPHLKATHIVANDLHGHLINFYKVASGEWGDAGRLVEQCSHTLSHPGELAESRAILDDSSRWDATSLAWAYWTQCWLGRKGKAGTAGEGEGMPSVRKTNSGGSNATRLRSAASDLPTWCRQFERCEFVCRDFRDLLEDVADKPKCGLYIDAPSWPGSNIKYVHSFTDADHRDLRDSLLRFEDTKVVVRYGEHPLIRDLYTGWQFVEATSRNQVGNSVDEVWITKQS